MGIFNRHRHLGPESLSEYLDGRLDHRHQELAARRLAECPACREELNTLQATVSALQSLPDLPLPRSFTLPAAPSPDYASNLIPKPAPPTPLIMKMPGWAYGGAASMAGLALALMLSAEAAGLASPATFQATGQTTGQATAAPGDAAVAPESQVEAKTEAQVPAPEMADQAEAPAGSQTAKPPQIARRAEPAPTSQAAPEIGELAPAAKSLVEPAAPEAALAQPAGPAPPTAMAESQAAFESGSGPAGEEAAAFSVTPPDAGTPGDTAISSDAGTPSDDPISAPEDSPPSVLAEQAITPAGSDQTQVVQAESPDENLGPPVEEYSAPSSPTWWKALELVFAALTLAFLGGLFFRWRRNRSQSDS